MNTTEVLDIQEKKSLHLGEGNYCPGGLDFFRGCL